jgi:mRNA interferase HigB
MRVHLIKRQTIENFAYFHSNSHSSFEDWLQKVKEADWMKPMDIKKTFATADLLGNGSERVVFDIGGNNYRMFCKYHFGITNVRLFVRWIGTHADYDKLCKSKGQYTI